MEQLINQLNKQFGKDTVAGKIQEVKNVIPTGSIALDKAIGVGGYPSQRVTELFGSEGVGKSTLSIHAVANTQKLGLGCVYVDAESTFDKTYAERIGVSLDPQHLIIIQPNTAEQALGVIEVAIQSPNIGMVILDSVAAMVPNRESIDQGEMGDSHVGLLARLMAQFMRRVTPRLKNSSAALLLVNQVRETISANAYGGKTTPGGWALKHGCSIRIQLSRKKIDKEEDEAANITIAAEIKKNKVAPPYEKAEFIIIGGQGIDYKYEICQLLLNSGIIIKSGSWYKTKEGNTVGQGLSSVYTWIDSNTPTVLNVLKQVNANEIYATRS